MGTWGSRVRNCAVNTVDCSDMACIGKYRTFPANLLLANIYKAARTILLVQFLINLSVNLIDPVRW